MKLENTLQKISKNAKLGIATILLSTLGLTGCNNNKPEEHKCLLERIHPGDILIYTPAGYNILSDMDGDGKPDVLDRTGNYHSPSYPGSKKLETIYFVKNGLGVCRTMATEDVEPEFFEKSSNILH